MLISRQVKNFWKRDKLIVEEINYYSKYTIWMKSPFWNRKSEETFIMRPSQCQVSRLLKESITVLVGVSVAGYILKPIVNCHSENPKAFKHINNETLPVYSGAMRCHG